MKLLVVTFTTIRVCSFTSSKYINFLIYVVVFYATFMASWSNNNMFASGAGDLRFKFQACQIKHSVANGSPSLRHFFKSCYPSAMTEDGRRKLVTRCSVIQRVKERFNYVTFNVNIQYLFNKYFFK